ncbi:conserved hypothetical protein, secreted [Candidatus Magnetomorum sp. HK-1]|nr:conserved hypothetical protein, secreted [Candidatus Magnetomorum sp. HK-1]
MNKTTRLSIFLLSCFMIMSYGNHVSAKISDKIYFQSILIDSNGTVASDGSYSVTFSIWDGNQETDQKLWEEQHTVLVEDGTYSVSLGSIVSFLDPDQNGDQSDSLTFAIPYYLGIKIQNDDYLKFDNKFPGLRSVVTAFRSSTSAGNLVNSVSSSYSITEQDDVVFVSGDSQIILPSANNLHGRIITIKNVDPTHATSVVTMNAETINAINCDILNSGAAFILPNQYDDLTVISNGQNWITLGFRGDQLGNYYTKEDLDQKFDANDITINSIQTSITQKAGYSEVYTRNTLDFILNSKASITETATLYQDTKSHRKPNALSLTDYEIPPPSTDEGDIYILCKSDGEFISGTLHGDWGAVSPGDMVKFTEGQWRRIDNISPEEGWTVFIEESNQLAIFTEGVSYSVWAIGSIGSPVDENSTDLNKNKLVSNNMMNQLMGHMNSDHAGSISSVVNKAFIENILTGEIGSHTHSGNAFVSSPLPTALTGSSGLYSYTCASENDLIDLPVNTVVTDVNNEKIALVSSHQFESGTSWEHPFSSGDRTASITVTHSNIYGGSAPNCVDGNETTFLYPNDNTGILTIIFSQSVLLEDIETIGDYDIKVGCKYSPDDSTGFSNLNLSSPVRVKRLQNSTIYNSYSSKKIYEIKFKCGTGQTNALISFSGQDFLPTHTIEKSDIKQFEHLFQTFAVSAGLFQSQYNLPYSWAHKSSQIYKIEAFSSDEANINVSINGSSVFGNTISTGNGNWVGSGLINEGANQIYLGDTLDFSSDASGSNLYIRLWFINF